MNDNIDHPVIKVASAWIVIGVTSWAEAASAGTFFASALAAIYAFALLWNKSNGQVCSAPGNRTCAGLWTDRLKTHAKCLGAQ